MAEKLIGPMDTAERINCKRTKFYDIRPRLIAMGLKTVRVGKQVMYLESSLDALIKRCAETGQTLG